MKDDNADTLEKLLYGILPLVEAIGARVIEARPGYARMAMPRSPLVVNHIGAFHAGALYTFAETAAGAAIAMSFDLMAVTVVNRRGEIRYFKLATESVESEAALPQKEIDRVNGEIEKNGKAVLPFSVALKNPDGVTACEADFDFILRKPMKKPG